MVTIKYLYSSSEGNATYVRVDDDVGIMIDAGMSYKKLLEALEVKSFRLDIILVTHEHTDHIKGLGVLGRKTGATIFIPELSYEKIKDKLKGCKIVFISGGDEFNYKGLVVSAFSTRHDSLASVGYSLLDTSNNKRYTHVTDTGVITLSVMAFIKKSNTLFIESDYDEYLLDRYPDYDVFLKMRIASSLGHLGNKQVVELLQGVVKDLDWVVLGHLSHRTNSKPTLTNLLSTKLNKSLVDKIEIFDTTVIEKELNANTNI